MSYVAPDFHIRAFGGLKGFGDLYDEYGYSDEEIEDAEDVASDFEADAADDDSSFFGNEFYESGMFNNPSDEGEIGGAPAAATPPVVWLDTAIDPETGGPVTTIGEDYTNPDPNAGMSAEWQDAGRAAGYNAGYTGAPYSSSPPPGTPSMGAPYYAKGYAEGYVLGQQAKASGGGSGPVAPGQPSKGGGTAKPTGGATPATPPGEVAEGMSTTTKAVLFGLGAAAAIGAVVVVRRRRRRAA